MTTVNGTPDYLVNLNNGGSAGYPYEFTVQDNGTEIFKVEAIGSGAGTVTVHGSIARATPLGFVKKDSTSYATMALFKVMNTTTSTTTDRLKLAYNSALSIVSSVQSGDYLRLLSAADANVQIAVTDSEGIICGFRSDDVARVQIGYAATGNIGWIRTPQSSHLLRLESQQQIELEKTGADGTIAMFRSNGTERAELSYSTNAVVMESKGSSDVLRLETEEHVQLQTNDDNGLIAAFRTGANSRLDVLYSAPATAYESVVRSPTNLTLQFAGTSAGALIIRQGGTSGIVTDVSSNGKWSWTDGSAVNMVPKATLEPRAVVGSGRQTRLALGVDDEERGVLRLNKGTFNTNDEAGTIIMEPQDGASGTTLFVFPWYYNGGMGTPLGGAGTYLVVDNADPGSGAPSGGETVLAGPY